MQTNTVTEISFHWIWNASSQDVRHGLATPCNSSLLGWKLSEKQQRQTLIFLRFIFLIQIAKKYRRAAIHILQNKKLFSA